MSWTGRGSRTYWPGATACSTRSSSPAGRPPARPPWSTPRVHEAGYLVGLHTAGPYPRRLAELLDTGLVDWVGIDVKAMPGAGYEQVAGRQGAGDKAWESLRVVLDHRRVDHEVRLTVYPDGPADGLEVARAVRAAGARRFALQQARALGAPDGFRASGVGWDDQVQALARDIRALGFESFEFRPA